MFFRGSEREQTVNAHGNYGQIQVRGQQSDAAAEGAHLSGIRAPAFREDQRAVAFVGQLAHKAEALAILGLLRQGEDVEERGNQNVAKLLAPAAQKEPLFRRMAHAAQHLTLHGRSQARA